MSARRSGLVRPQSRTTRAAVIELLDSWAAGHRDVNLLVLFGSVARGDDHQASDVDLLISGPVTDDPAAMTRLRGELAEALARPVGLLTLSEAIAVAPVFVGVLRDGRVVLDRLNVWASVLATRARVEQHASAEITTYPARKAAALARLSIGGRG